MKRTPPGEGLPPSTSSPELTGDRAVMLDDLTREAVLPSPDMTGETPSIDPYSAMGELIARIPEADRDAAEEYFMGHIVEPAGATALDGAGIDLDDSTPAVPVVPTIPATTAPSPDKHTTIDDEDDPDPVPVPATAPVVPIRPGVATAEPVKNSPGSLGHRLETAKKLMDTSKEGERSYRERRYINRASRDARTEERRRIKDGDESVTENSILSEKSAAQELASNALEIAKHHRMREVRTQRLHRELGAKEASIKEALTVDGVLDQKAFRARLKTAKKALKKSIDKETKEKLDTAKTTLDTKNTEHSAAYKNRRNAIKGRRWYRNTRFSSANKSGAGVNTLRSRTPAVASIRPSVGGGGGRSETDEERRRRLAAARARAA